MAKFKPIKIKMSDIFDIPRELDIDNSRVDPIKPLKKSKKKK